VKTIDIKHRQNGFDLLRHVAALLVLFGHAYPLCGRPGPGYLGNTVQTIAVKIFFVTSGFLICRSWLSDPHVGRYFVRRALRILPGLIVVVLFSMFVLGPWFTELPLGTYLRAHNTWQYLRNLLLFPEYGLPGVFLKNTYPGAINGSLWTIPVEVSMYLTLPLILGVTSQGGRVGVVASAVLLGAFKILYLRVNRTGFPHVIYGTDIVDAIDVSVYFQIGAVYAVFGLDKYARPLLSILLFSLPIALFYNDILGEIALWVVLPFLVISVGGLHLPIVDQVLRGHDLSYGLYLYGFLMQQAIQAMTHNTLTPHENFAVAAGICVLCALLSWNIVERRALALKPSRRQRETRVTI
jgi:peptidoglycan/LPS O-acetylase OafA/YrhL